MSLASFSRWSGAFAVLGILFFFDQVAKGDDAAKPKPSGEAVAKATPDSRLAPADSPAEKIRKALEQNVSLDVAEQPLLQAIQQLRDAAKVNMIVDRASIQNMGIAVEEANVTLKLENVKARSALRTLLGQHNLGYVIIGDTLIVTTEEMAIQRQVRQRVNVDFKEVPLQNALKQLARETAANVVLDARAAEQGKAAVTMTLEDVPLETAVRLLAEMADLKPVQIGNVLFVTTAERAAKLLADPQTIPMPPVGMPGMGGAGIMPVPPAMVKPVPGVAPATAPAMPAPPVMPEPKPDDER